MDGLIFNQAEFLALMSAVNASELLGIDSNTIVPTDKKIHQEMTLSGLQQLKVRGIVEETGGTMLFPSELIGMASAISEPQLVTQVMREEPDVGQRQIMMYQAFQFIVEFTMPEEGMFRLARIPSTLAMLQRIHFLLSIGDRNTQQLSFVIDQNAFFQSKSALDNDNDDLALDILKNGGVPSDEASALLTAMKDVQLSGMVTLLRTENGSVLDGRELISLKTNNSSWIFYQKKAGVKQLAVETVDRELFLTAAYQLQTNLIQANQK